jgi:nucleoside-diphosphate-sugar epimerase
VARVVVIGATGHIGSYLVPRLVRAGHQVVAISRGERKPYHEAVEWRSVQCVDADRAAEDVAGSFGQRIAALQPDAVVDLICFTPASAQHLVDALRPLRPLLLHCGTIWVHGRTARVPLTEDEPRTAFGEYGVDKAAIEALLHRQRLPVASPASFCIPVTSAGLAGL